jgi:hypothetical protein
MTDWFAAHKDGLRQVHERLVERRGFGIIGGELYQNVMDTDATTCIFNVKKLPSRPRIQIEVEDDGHGFRDLTHAWTMFAPSEKKVDPTKAGRFNVGEKVVLSFAYEATIHTTSGMVVFDSSGRHEHPRRKRDRGTLFAAELACNRDRFEELLEYLRKIIVRPGLTLIVNGEELPRREPVHVFEEALATEIGEDLRRSVRKTGVQIFEAGGDEVPSLYELGIPIVETGDKWHVNVLQKVPLNTDRDNVTPAYLRSVRTAVYNEMHRQIDSEDTVTSWVNEAAADPNCSDDAAETFRLRKYGKRSVASDPSNPEADAEALAYGFTVIPSRGLSRGQRDNLYRAGTLRTSSKAFPTAGKGPYSDDPEAPPVEVIPPEKWSDGMKMIHEYTVGLGQRLLDKNVQVRFVHCSKFGGGKRWEACYGRGCLPSGHFDYNVFVLGRRWFEQGASEAVDDLILHEFGHDSESNHLCAAYHEALTRLGAKLKAVALQEPGWFLRYQT